MILDAAKIAAARLWAASRLPYLASAVFACSIRSTPGTGTVQATRSWGIEADPELVAELDAAELGRTLLHLVGHLLREHADRALAVGVDDTSRRWWLRCADAEINDDLRRDECVPKLAPDLPADLGCADHGLAEKYFATRPSEEPQRVRGCGPAADGSEPGEDASGLTAAQAQLLRWGVAAEIQQRERSEPGTVSAGWVRWAEQVLPSRTDWRRVLAAEVRAAVAAVRGNVDYSYARPSRRTSVSPDVILPSLVRPVPDVAIVCDTSGSMHDGLLARVLAEVEGLLVRTGLPAGRVRVLSVDTEVHATSRPRRAAQVRLAGGGVTDMGAGLAAAEALRPKPAVVIVLTDGFTPWPERPPRGVRVVIGLLLEYGDRSERETPTWARVVRIEDDLVEAVR